MLSIQFSNRFETLQDALLDGVGGARASVFAAEQIIVPSAAIKRKLSLAIADRYGICSNVEFSFLEQWLWRQIGQVLPSVAAESPFATPVLAWRIFEIFGDPGFVAEHQRLRDYLSNADPVMRHALAERSARLLDQYMTYRPDWLAAWSAGRPADIGSTDTVHAADQNWQAALWRRIAAQIGTDREHPAVSFLRTLEAAGSPRGRLPAMAHVFCLPTMPPLYIDMLHRLGRWIDLRLYVLNPCREYWFEVVDRRRLSHLAVQGEASYHEEGNRLLAAWGQQTQAQIDLLLQDAGDGVVDDAHFNENPAATLLARVQNAVLNLVDLAPATIALAADDRSIEVHVCHSMTRELEVLQDRLLALFAGDDPPQPSDILVVTPDIEAAAPLIEAVFGNVPHARAIPYTVTGRARSTVNASARALLALLALVGSRFQASSVFELLQQPGVGRRFGLQGDELLAVRDWITQSAIRWGLDAAHRAAFDLPEVERHSFADGLHRLYLGYALPSSIETPFNHRLPAGDAEGTDAVALGAFWHFVAALERWHRELPTPKTPDGWQAALFETLAALLAPSDDEIDNLREVQAALRELHAQMAAAGVATAIPLDVVRKAMQALLDDPARGGVPTGAVTFASIASLRSLPYRVVCAIGLDDGAFPTSARPAEFDLMAIRPRRGDRQRRHDERNLFLDWLLAARERLHLSYTGRSVRDNAPLPASVLVSELVEYLVPAIAADASAAGHAAARARLVVAQPLQPFSLECFGAAADARLRSFNQEYCEALQRRLEASSTAPASQAAFFALPLAEPGPEWRQVSLEQLIRFFRNPSRYLLQRRLGIELSNATDELQDDEPFLPEFRGRGALAERLLPHLLQASDGTDLRTLARAGTEYPAGRLGELLLERELQSLASFAQALRQAGAAPCLAPHDVRLAFDLHGEPWQLSGSFSELRATGLVRHRYDDTRAVDYLDGWLSHLLLCASPPVGVEPQTSWHSRDGVFVLQPADNAQAALRDLLLLYRQGLSRPLHFYPKSAWSFIKGGGKRGHAEGSWRSTRQRPFGEDAEAAYRLALRGVDEPLDEEFEACADAVFGTMRCCLQDARL